MTQTNKLPKLDFKINIPEFTAMRITPPLRLQPIKIIPLDMKDKLGQYQALSKQIMQKIGVNFKQQSNFLSSFVSELSCMNCTACKAMSKQTLMQINANDLQPVDGKQKTIEENENKSQQTQDEQKKQRFEKIWKQSKKKHLRPSIIKFEVAYKKHSKLSDQEWVEKIKQYFK